MEPNATDTVQLLNPTPGLEQRRLDVIISKDQLTVRPHDGGRLQILTYYPTEAGTFRIMPMFAASVGQIALKPCPPPDQHIWEVVSQEGEPVVRSELGLRMLVNVVAQGIHKRLHDLQKPDGQ